jgi:hypothetical protein
MKERVIPVETLSDESGRLEVPFTRQKVAQEPDFDTAADHIIHMDELKLCSYFGMGGTHPEHNPRILRYGEPYTDG